VRTRGESSQMDRVRPTATVRHRGCGGGDNIPEAVEVEENVNEEINVDINVDEDESYLGGPMDKSLLLSYENHVVRQLRDGVVSSLLWFK